MCVLSHTITPMNAENPINCLPPPGAQDGLEGPLGHLLLHLGGGCLRANVQPLPVVHFIAATVLTGL